VRRLGRIRLHPELTLRSARLIEQLLGSFAVARRAPCEEHLVQLAA
jgi:hypothetical protein